MIDEDRTMQLFGYMSSELKPMSRKHIVCVCEECGRHRILKKSAAATRTLPGHLCKECQSHRSVPQSQKDNASKSRIGKKRPPRPQEWCDNISKGKLGKPTKLKGFERTFEHKKLLSAIGQGISVEEWTGFSDKHNYCVKFNDDLKLKIRTQYDFECVMCDMTEEESKAVYDEVLSIHHVDGNKDQGCNGNGISMIPLCKKCHGKSHWEPMLSRIDYLVKIGVLV